MNPSSHTWQTKALYPLSIAYTHHRQARNTTPTAHFSSSNQPKKKDIPQFSNKSQIQLRPYPNPNSISIRVIPSHVSFSHYHITPQSDKSALPTHNTHTHITTHILTHKPPPSYAPAAWPPLGNGPFATLTIPIPVIADKNLPLCLLNGAAAGAASLPHAKVRRAMLLADKAR